MPANFKLRRIAGLLLLPALGLAALVLSFAYWLPPLLPGLAGQFDLQVEQAERTETGRIRAIGLRYAADGAVVEAEAVELPSPLPYLWERWRGDGYSTETELILEGVRVSLAEVGATERESASPAESLDRFRRGLEQVRPWLPAIRADRLTVRGEEWPGPLVLPELALVDGILRMGTEAYAGWPAARLRLELPADGPWSARLEPVDGDLRLNAELAPSGEGWGLAAELRRAEDRVELVAEWKASEPLPATAALRTDGFTIREDWIRRLYENHGDGSVRIERMEAGWDGSRYVGTLRLSGTSPRLGDGTGAGELAAELDFTGDRKTIRIDRWQLRTDWLESELSAPLRFRFGEGLAGSAAELRLRAELGAQDLFEAGGRIEGTAGLRAEEAGGLRLDFALEGRELEYQGEAIGWVRAAGRYEGGRVELDEVLLRPEGGAEGDRIRVTGIVDPQARTLALDYEWQAERADWLNERIGLELFAGSQAIDGSLGGSWTRPQLEGRMELSLAPEGLNPFSLAGDFRMEGDPGARAVPAFAFDGEARAGAGSLRARLEGGYGAGRLRVDLQELASADAARTLLELRRPTRIEWDVSDSSIPIEERLSVAPFELVGPGRRMEGSREEGGPLRLRLRNWSAEGLDPWIAADLPEVLIESADLELRAVRPSLSGRFSVVAKQAVPFLGTTQLALRAAFDGEGVELPEIELRLDDETLLDGSLRLPLRFQLAEREEAGPFQWDSSAPLSGRLTAHSNEAVAAWLADRTGARLGSADLELELGGRLEAPEGRLEASLDDLALPEGRMGSALPPLRDLRLSARADGGPVRIESLEFRVNESRVEGEGALPMAALLDWSGGGREAWSLLREAEGRLRLRDWKAADWTGLLPEVLRRTGEMTGELSLSPGLELAGELEFSEFGLRPTAALLPVDRIHGRVRLKDRVLSFERAGARFGGIPLDFVGRLDLREPERPVWRFTASGRNVPLARTTDMILRSDIDLTASQEADGAAPLVAGRLDLRQSTLLLEFDPLSPGVRSGPRRAPPFFAIEEEPFADWRFDLEIRGDDFLRVRSPYFRGLLSADFDLGGRFARPKLIGSVLTEDAELRFPGAKIKLDRGEAFIEEGRSEVVQLEASGVARTGSYIIAMDLSNTLDDPHIEFQSTPGLTNAQIVRLLATGSTRSGGAGTVGLYLGKGLLAGPGMDDGLMDRLTIDLGEQVTREGKETVAVRYDLSEDYYLKGEYDEYDAYTLDLVWSLFER